MKCADDWADKTLHYEFINLKPTRTWKNNRLFYFWKPTNMHCETSVADKTACISMSLLKKQTQTEVDRLTISKPHTRFVIEVLNTIKTLQRSDQFDSWSRLELKMLMFIVPPCHTMSSFLLPLLLSSPLFRHMQCIYHWPITDLAFLSPQRLLNRLRYLYGRDCTLNFRRML